jgi:hypothetical protein
MEFLKKYRSTLVFAILIVLLNYLNWPTEPMMSEKGSELHELVGMPEYFGTQDPHLKVNGMNLKCDLDGSDGCGYYKNLMNAKMPVSIRYIRTPSLLWGHYSVLYSLEQDGRMIISPEQPHARILSHFSSSLETHKYFVFVWIPILAVVWLGDFFGFAQHQQKFFEEARNKVNEQFLKIGIDEDDSQYVLKGSTATIVQDKESDGGGEGCSDEYHLTRFARNPSGEYFMLMFTVIDDQVSMILFKHVVQTNARIALKDKYLPPQ